SGSLSMRRAPDGGLPGGSKAPLVDILNRRMSDHVPPLQPRDPESIARNRTFRTTVGHALQAVTKPLPHWPVRAQAADNGPCIVRRLDAHTLTCSTHITQQLPGHRILHHPLRPCNASTQPEAHHPHPPCALR